ncbi:MAG: hypothetical protein ACKVQA_15285 [Burkholderiales bacterium]
MVTGKTFRKTVVVAFSALAFASAAKAEKVHYPFSAAAQEIAQLIWLAETANVCGWATRGETEQFELFAVRFLSAHLEGTYKVAFVGMVGNGNYLEKVRTVAIHNANETCKMARWQSGWTVYKAAAEENYGRY